MAQTLKFGNGTWATKKDSILAYNDENENYKPLPFNYTGAGKGTRVNKEGLIEVVENDRPRIDYLDSEDGVFLLEKAATNLITYSEDFSNGSWIKTNTTIQLNSSISPDGTNNASNLIPSTSSGVHNVKSLTNLTNSYCSGSWFVKANGYNKVSLREDGVLGRYMSCDLSNGTILDENATTSAEIENYGNGWYRIKFTDVVVSTGTRISMYVLPDTYTNGSPNSLNWSGNGTDGVLIFGAMLEDASNVSSYIPTQGTIQTRVQETASGSGNSEVFNDSEGVLFADISALADDGTNRFISVNSGSQTNRIAIYFDTSNNLNGQLRVGGSTQASITDSSSNILNFNKVAFKYKQNDVSFYVNGFEIGVDNNANVFANGTLNSLNYDVGGGTLDFYGKTKEIDYYDTALTDSELEYITSFRSLNELVTTLKLNKL